MRSRSRRAHASGVTAAFLLRVEPFTELPRDELGGQVDNQAMMQQLGLRPRLSQAAANGYGVRREGKNRAHLTRGGLSADSSSSSPFDIAGNDSALRTASRDKPTGQHRRALKLLAENRERLDRLARTLLEGDA